MDDSRTPFGSGFEPPQHGNRAWRHHAMVAAHHHGHRGGARFGMGFGPFGPGGFGPGNAFYGRGPRVGRGDVRSAILVLLGEQPMHGYQIIQELSSRSGGVWRPSPGSVYPTLQQLEDEGLVHGEEADGRRVFHLTDEGKADVDRREDDQRAPWEIGDQTGPFVDMRKAGLGLVSAVMQVAQTGSPDQVARATSILNDARKRLYSMLAEDEEPVTSGTHRGDEGDPTPTA
jgi:DNA-binding PadR family transcriptional regulator